MRRTKADLSYKDSTRNIMDNSFKPWQLPRKDEREGVHRLVNNIVSYIEELGSETSYIENMFFPEQMDLTEEWVIYQTYPRYGIDQLFISGEPITEVCKLVSETDNFVSNGFDISKPIDSIIFTGNVESINLLYGKVEILSDRKIHTISTITKEVISVVNSDIILSGDMTIIVSPDERQFTITEKLRPESIKLTYNGSNVPITVKNSDIFTAPWVAEFDADNNGLIGDYEERLVRFHQGHTATEYSPSEWGKIAWMDIDEDGVISDKDTAIILNHIGAIAPGIEHVITVSGSRTGIMTLEYEHHNPKAVMFAKETCEDYLITDYNIISNAYYKVAYEPKIDVFFGITKDKKNLRAFKYSFINRQITSDLLMYLPGMTASSVLVDLDTSDGYLYVLTNDGNTSKILYDEVRVEYIESLSKTADVILSEVPTGFTSGPDGSFIISVPGHLRLMSAERDRCMEVDGAALFNQKRPYTLSNGTAVKIVPSYVFNNFDAFAYSLGIERPYGMDNPKFRNIIMDFWVHRQDNSRYGMNNGIMRELGIIPKDLSYVNNTYNLPENITTSGNSWYLALNGIQLPIIQSGEMLVFSGETGRVTVTGGSIFTFSENILESNSTVNITSFFLDAKGDPIYLTYPVKITKGVSSPDISVDSYNDTEFLTSIGYIISGEPTSQLIEYIRAREIDDPFTYRNAIVDVTPMDMKRTTPEPIVPTIFDPVLSGTLSGMTRIDIII